MQQQFMYTPYETNIARTSCAITVLSLKSDPGSVDMISQCCKTTDTGIHRYFNLSPTNGKYQPYTEMGKHNTSQTPHILAPDRVINKITTKLSIKTIKKAA